MQALCCRQGRRKRMKGNRKTNFEFPGSSQASIPAAVALCADLLIVHRIIPRSGPYCDLLNKLEKACPHLRELSFSYPPAEEPLFSAPRGCYNRDESVRCTARLLRASFWTHALPSGTRCGREPFQTNQVIAVGTRGRWKRDQQQQQQQNVMWGVL